MKVKTHKFSSGVFQIVRERIDGLCDMPECNHPTHRGISVNPDLEGKDELETWVHESLHAEFPQMSEAKVTAAGANIARLLWRLGYRKRKE